MKSRKDPLTVIRAISTPVALAMLLFGMTAAGIASAQTYQVIYNFTGCGDGNTPTGTLLMDRAGSLYGTTEYGGLGCSGGGAGVAFRLKRAGAGWVETPLHTFDGDDGAFPVNYGGLVFGPDGNIYGTTEAGGASVVGTVFRLQPPARACQTALCPWNETVLYNFEVDNATIPTAGVTFDSAGNLFGVTIGAGYGLAAAYKLTPSGGNWSASVIADVTGSPMSSLTMDAAGNLYGTTNGGGNGLGSVFELSRSSLGWTLTTLYAFTGAADGYGPIGGVVFDAAENLYGTTNAGGEGNGGTVFELSPSAGGWALTTLYSFSGIPDDGPVSTLTWDAAGNLYGTTSGGGAFSAGSVFKMTRSESGWTFSDIHDFRADSNGYGPQAGVTIDASGNLYGTTSEGGAHNAGVVWKITP